MSESFIFHASHPSLSSEVPLRFTPFNQIFWLFNHDEVICLTFFSCPISGSKICVLIKASFLWSPSFLLSTGEKMTRMMFQILSGFFSYPSLYWFIRAHYLGFQLYSSHRTKI